STLKQQPDPAAPNGGSYVVPVFPTQDQQMTVVFSMPENATFLLRRQPGLTTATVQVDVLGCGGSYNTSLTSDRAIDPAALCRPAK
ncbi:MAG TPA: hypothetical protein VHV31_08985, partial [Nitrolancea sp.]|nr:hypothetical protein [Nitrolancea sp.]